MTKNETRVAIRAYLTGSAQYDATTMQINRDGIVSAKKDADKTFAGNDPIRYRVGHVDAFLVT
jgi:hypothetical protein